MSPCQKFWIALSVFFTLSEGRAQATDWQAVGKEICQSVEQSVSYYEKGQQDQAHLGATMAYFQQYDVKLEPTLRTTVGNATVFAREQEFRALTKQIMLPVNAANIETLKTLSKTLCSHIQQDVEVLIKEELTTAH